MPDRLTDERVAELERLAAANGIVDARDEATGEVFRTVKVCPWEDIAALLAERGTLRDSLREFNAEAQLSLVRPGRLREWKERFAALEGDKP